MLSIEKIIDNYEELMVNNGYSEEERLRNTEVIRNALGYSLKEKLKADTMLYSMAKKLYPNIKEWNDIPSSYLDILLDINVVPSRVITRENRKYLACIMGSYGSNCSNKFLELDITDDQYESDGENDDAVQKTNLKWRLHCNNIRSAVNAVELKSLKDEFGSILIDYIGDESYKNIETKFLDAMQLIVYVDNM